MMCANWKLSSSVFNLTGNASPIWCRQLRVDRRRSVHRSLAGCGGRKHSRSGAWSDQRRTE